MPLCVLGDLEDLAATYVAWLARERGAEVLELAEGMLGVAWDYDFHDSSAGSVRAGSVRAPWNAITGVFVRLNPVPPLPPGVVLDDRFRDGFVRERREGLHQLLETLDCAVINRPSAGRSNASKPYQMGELSAAEFDVPRWTASSSPEAVLAFVDTCPHGAIYKASSGLRSRVRKVDDEFWERLRDGTTPTVVQEYVPGTDVRVHTVGEAAFACEVRSSGVDYRFEHDDASYVATTIPQDFAAMCCRHAARAGLVLAGFDFRRTADGRLRCLEMNPVPSFLPYEFSSGLPIGAAIVDVLTATQTQTAAVSAG